MTWWLIASEKVSPYRSACFSGICMSGTETSVARLKNPFSMYAVQSHQQKKAVITWQILPDVAGEHNLGELLLGLQDGRDGERGDWHVLLFRLWLIRSPAWSGGLPTRQLPWSPLCWETLHRVLLGRGIFLLDLLVLVGEENLQRLEKAPHVVGRDGQAQSLGEDLRASKRRKRDPFYSREEAATRSLLGRS